MKPSENEPPIDKLISNCVGRNRLEFNFAEWKLDHTDAIRAFQETIKQNQTSQALAKPIPWRTIMRHKFLRYSVAALVMISLWAGITFFGGAPDMATVAWADIVDRVQQCKGAITRHHMVSKQGDKESITEGLTYTSRDYGLKTSMARNGEPYRVIYVQPNVLEALVIMPKRKMYMRVHYDETLSEHYQEGINNNDPREILKRIVACEHIELEDKTINDVAVRGLQSSDPNCLGRTLSRCQVTVWVDLQTGWPVLIDMDMEMDAGPNADDLKTVHLVMDQFQWDVDIDPSEFTPNIPADFTEMADVQMPGMDMTAAVDALKFYAETVGGYPADLQIQTLLKGFEGVFKQEVINAEETPERQALLRAQASLQRAQAAGEGIVAAQEAVNAAQADWDAFKKARGAQLMQNVMRVQGAVAFYDKLTKEGKKPHYFGETVTPQDTKDILLLWEEDNGHFAVLYGDLTTAVIAPEDLPESYKPVE